VTVDALNCQRRDRAANHRSGRRLRLRPQGQSGHAPRRLSARSLMTRADQGHDGTLHGRRRSWPHRNPRRRDLDGYLTGCRAASMAGSASDRKVTRIRETGDKTSTETAYYLFSTPLSQCAAVKSCAAIGAWKNRLHWCLDVVMNEDAARNRMDNGPHNLAVLRHNGAQTSCARREARHPYAENSKQAPGMRIISSTHSRFF